MTDDIARLLAEAVPDGTFGGARPPAPPPEPPPLTPDPRAAEHVADLLAALKGPAAA